MRLRCLFAFVVLGMIVCGVGCGRDPSVDEAGQPSGNESSDKESSDKESSGNAASESPALALQGSRAAPILAPLNREPVVPGTDVVRSIDDPSQDGWETESVAAAVGDQLKHLLGDVEELDSHLTLFATPGATCSSVGSDTKVSYDHGGVTVRRAGLSTIPQKDMSIAEGVRSLLKGIDGQADVRSKVKVFRVDVLQTGVSQTGGQVQRRAASCSAYVQLAGACSEGRFQVNATLECQWRLQGRAAPLLERLEVRQWEQVIARHEGESMFVDCTAAVMQDEEVFRAQLLPGIDHWLDSIETRMGIDIGGWQGISIADVNGDGLDDLYCAQPGGLPNRLFLQQSDGTCVEDSERAGLDWLDSSHASLFVDLDNDGDQDAVVGLNDGVLVMANDGQGRFSVRAQKILPAALPYSISAADFDNDSDLDIYICCYNRRSGVNQHLLFARPVPYHDANNGGRNVLLMNEIESADSESWDFRYVTKRLGLDANNRRFSYASAWEDFDNDGDLDLYVANDFGRNSLYRNDSGTFRDVAAEAGVEDISPGMSACWGDYNNDGNVDLYVSNMFSSAGNRIAFQDRFHDGADREIKAKFQRHARGNSLFQNQGDGVFRDVSDDARVTLGRWAWGSRFADLNNDGWQDLIVANGFITQPDTGDL